MLTHASNWSFIASCFAASAAREHGLERRAEWRGMGNGMRMEWVLSFAVKFENQAAVDGDGDSVLQKPLRASTRRSKTQENYKKISKHSENRENPLYTTNGIRPNCLKKLKYTFFFLEISILRWYFLQWVCVRGFFFWQSYFENILFEALWAAFENLFHANSTATWQLIQKIKQKNLKKRKQSQNKHTHAPCSDKKSKI